MKYIRKNIKIITIILILLLTIGLIILKIYLNNKSSKEETPLEIVEEQKEKEESDEQEEQPQQELVYVDIKGAVKTPGVYEIENNKKVIDVINLAGGLLDNADTILINLSKQVTNEMVIIIYTQEEIKNSKKDNTVIKVIDKECNCPEITNDSCIENNKENKDKNDETTLEETSSKVNINKASLEELLAISGIGESKAKAIIDYRKEKGKFNNIEEIKQVSGIGEALYEKIKEHITI